MKNENVVIITIILCTYFKHTFCLWKTSSSIRLIAQCETKDRAFSHSLRFRETVTSEERNFKRNKFTLDNSEELWKCYILSVKLFSVLVASLRGLGAKVNSWWSGDSLTITINYCYHILASRRYLVAPRHLTRSTNCRRELSTSFVSRPAMMLEPGLSRMLCPLWLHRNHPMLLKVGVSYTLAQNDVFPRSSIW